MSKAGGAGSGSGSGSGSGAGAGPGADGTGAAAARTAGRCVEEGSLSLWLGVLMVGTIFRFGPLALGAQAWVGKRQGIHVPISA